MAYFHGAMLVLGRAITLRQRISGCEFSVVFFLVGPGTRGNNYFINIIIYFILDNNCLFPCATKNPHNHERTKCFVHNFDAIT